MKPAKKFDRAESSTASQKPASKKSAKRIDLLASQEDGPKGRPFFFSRAEHTSLLPNSMTEDELQRLIEDATADYAIGENESALAKLATATAADPTSFEGWHALAEVNFSLRRLDAALTAAERAHALRPGDLFINTTLSRIWMERGDKARAEHFGAQAKIQSWKDQLKSPAPDDHLK